MRPRTGTLRLARIGLIIVGQGDVTVTEPRVTLEIQTRVNPHDIAAALADAGATEVRLDLRSGDAYSGVSSNYFLEFVDVHGRERQRVAAGFVANVSDEHENGWTRFRLGSDERGRHFVDQLARRFGGRLVDERTDEKFMVEAEDAPVPAFA